MKIAKALLFTLMFMSGLFWFMSWNWTLGDYPPVEQMLSIQGKVVSISGRQNKGTGWLTLESGDRTLDFTLWIGRKTLKQYGDLTGKEVLVKVHPKSDFSSKKYTPRVSHLELVGGPVVADYTIEREKYFDYMKSADGLILFFRTLFFIFMALFALCFFKRGGKS